MLRFLFGEKQYPLFLLGGGVGGPLQDAQGHSAVVALCDARRLKCYLCSFRGLTGRFVEDFPSSRRGFR